MPADADSFRQLDAFIVSADGSRSDSHITLETDVKYRVVVTGDFLSDTADGNTQVDAEFISTPRGASPVG